MTSDSRRVISARGAFALALASLVLTVLSRLSLAAPVLDPLADALPLWILLAATSIPAALAGFQSRPGEGLWRGLAAMLGVIALVVGSAVVVEEFARPAPPRAESGVGRSIRVIQMNIWDDCPNSERALDWLDHQKPDIVTMEEARPQVILGMLRRGFGVGRFRGHVTIFSRLPFQGRSDRIGAQWWRMLPPLARESFQDPGTGQRFTVVALHLTHPEAPHAEREAAWLFSLLRRYDHRTLIVAGDLNRTPWSSLLSHFDQRLGLVRLDHGVPSWPSAVRLGSRTIPTPPALALDHIYIGPAWRVARFETGPYVGSDHRPLIADLVLSP